MRLQMKACLACILFNVQRDETLRAFARQCPEIGGSPGVACCLQAMHFYRTSRTHEKRETANGAGKWTTNYYNAAEVLRLMQGKWPKEKGVVQRNGRLQHIEVRFFGDTTATDVV